MKISIVGAGYVGLSLAILISEYHEVYLLDVDEKKIDLINKKKSPINDKEILNYLSSKKLNLIATLNKNDAYDNSDFVIVATPTNYNHQLDSFDTSSVENVISDVLNINKNITIVIKSTVPFGFTDSLKEKYKSNNIFYSPEFLRENMALYDNIHPSRIIVGDTSNEAKIFGKILSDCAISNLNKSQIMYMTSKEAESVKLFSNTYLAMRISFFNELDSFAESNSLSSEKIIRGVSLDSRIGNYYNNPSFGYGGYCLPKDSKQLLRNFNSIPNKIIRATVESNQIRKDFITKSILNKQPQTVGVYRLIMKDGSDNFRESAIVDILNNLKEKNISIIIFEPLIEDDNFNGISIIKDIDYFLTSADLIIANRLTEDLEKVLYKVYTRDIFNIN
tara:strand:+ start:93 stop:1265 length:1173 start_codon:yes stop_codon:yes gene_type:complete